MYLTFSCPQCDQSNQSPDLSTVSELRCQRCDWRRPFSDRENELKSESVPHECLRCGNPDLWRQKNFPQSLGLLFVALGAISSSIAWSYYRPILAISILMCFALLDMVLYIVMSDVLVCYRCRTKHHNADVSRHAAFNHELAEKYRQERIRLEQAQRDSLPPSDDSGGVLPDPQS